MEYPHWLMIAGAVLVVLGFAGLLVFRQRKDDEAEIKETANGNEQGRSELEVEPVQTQETNRTAKLAEQARERWTRSERDKIR
jgi:type VI protein secretion system component VasK